jgi:uncharacterized SAM-binding protein YcdF (DUF218 family)
MIILAGIGALLLALVLFHRPIFIGLGDFLAEKSVIQPADILHVISGPDYRSDYGIELVKEGYASDIFFTGGWCDEIQGYHGERGRARALDQGLSGSEVAIDDSKVVSTYEEATLLKKYLDATSRQVHSIIVVSDPYHMRRVEWTYQMIFGPSVKIILAPVPFERTPFKENWWTDAESTRNVEEEYIKLGYSILRYQVGFKPLSSWLASMDVK